MNDIVDAGYQVVVIGVAALFFIVIMKLIMARWPVPGLAQVVAMA